MRSSFLGLAAVLLSMGLASSVQTQTSDTLQALKDSLSPDQQSSILQGVLGKGDGTGTTTDKKLDVPNSMESRADQLKDNPVLKLKKEETYDGRVLRRMDENPELRAGDMVL